MPTERFSDALTIELPTGFRTSSPPAVTTTRGRGGRNGRGRLPSGRVPLDPGGAADGADLGAPGLLAALSDQGFDLVDQPVLLEPDPQATRRRAGPARLNVEVNADQDAVILVEQDGMFSWRAPDERAELEPSPDRRRSPLDAPVGRRRIAFDVQLVASKRSETRRRGWVEDLAFSKVRVFVLKYVARKIVGSAMRHLEAHIQPGLREISGTDPLRWAPFTGEVDLPTGRPPRVLLFVHGTFSSTIGGFGALGATAHGRELLDRAEGRYDLVIGYDHLTLSVDPSANGAELLTMLREVDWPEPPVFDIVCHSRGALVTRSLIEQALPQSGWQASVDRVVFVAGVNAGTYLAAPKNWARLVDLYTNLAAAAARLLPEQVASTILGELIKGVGALVKFTVSYAVDEQGAPGLAAMEPDGKYVKELNRTQAGQPLPTTTAWFVIAGEFEPDLSLANVRTLPKRLVMALADTGVDQLMRQPNDLVVHVASMSAIDSPVGQASQFVQDVFVFGPKDGVFHTIYFDQPATSRQLTEWLNLVPTTLPAQRGAAPSQARGAGRQRTRSLEDPVDEELLAPVAPHETHAEPTVAATVTAHFRASMPPTAQVGKTVTVRATISREALAAVTGPGEDSSRLSLDADRPVTVQIVVKAHAEVVGEDFADVEVPVTAVPIDLFFSLRPLAAGQGEVHVVARQGPVPMATLVLKPEFVEGPIAANRRPRGPLSAAAENLPGSVPSTCVKQWLRITERQIGALTVYDFELQAEDLGVLANGTSRPLTGSREDYVEQLYQRIEDRWVSTQGDREQFGRELKALGGELFDELIPAEFGELLWTRRKELRNILILSDEPFIPWEIVHLKNGRKLPAESWFLGRLGAMRWFQGVGYPPAELSLKKVRYCVPEYPIEDLVLPSTAAEAEFLRSKLHGTRVKPTSEAVLSVLGKPGSFDVFHFAGHGEAEGSSSRILLEGRIEDDAYIADELTETTLSQYAELAELDAKKRPIVVFNACQAGRQVPKLTHVGGFARAMVSRGAGAFLSSLWSVVDEPATDFSTALYEALQDGKTLAEASIIARDAARAGDDEATWLAYVVYGNPCATVAH